MEQTVSQMQEASKNEALERGSAFEELIRVRGWKFISAYIENAIRVFANTSINKGFASLEEMNLERGKVLGMQRMLAEIESSIKTLEDERTRANNAAASALKQ